MSLKKLYVLIIALVFAAACGGSDTVPADKRLESMGKGALDQIKAENAGKVILVNFFASWCPPCRAETPDFVKAYKANSDRFVIVALSMDDKMSDAVKYIDEFSVPYKVYMAEPGLAKQFGITTIPTNIFYKPDGTLYDIVVGGVSEQRIEETIDKLTK